MFIMDVPYLPQQAAQIILAQADTTNSPVTIVPPFEKTYTGCKDVVDAKISASSTGPGSFNSMALLPRVLRYMGYIQTGGNYNVPPEIRATIKSGVLEAPTHGKITMTNAEHHVYNYEAEPDYEGKDKVVFWIEVNGKRFKSVTNLWVMDWINIGDEDYCKGIKFNMLPADMGQGWQATGPIFLNLAK